MNSKIVDEFPINFACVYIVDQFSSRVTESVQLSSF